jgi:hypothetical protein
MSFSYSSDLRKTKPGLAVPACTHCKYHDVITDEYQRHGQERNPLKEQLMTS